MHQGDNKTKGGKKIDGSATQENGQMLLVFGPEVKEKKLRVSEMHWGKVKEITVEDMFSGFDDLKKNHNDPEGDPDWIFL